MSNRASQITKNLQYYKFCVYGFLKNQLFFKPFFLLYFLDKGLSFLQIGTLVVVREVTVNVFEIPTGIIADTLGRRRTMLLSFSSYIISFVLFYLVTNVYLLCLAMLFFGFGDAFRSGTHKAMIFEYLKSNHWEHLKADYYGHTRSWSQIGSAISALLAAGLVFFTEGYEWIFILSTIPYCLNFMLIASYPASLEGSTGSQDSDLSGIYSRLSGKILKIMKALRISLKEKNAFLSMLNLSVFSGYTKITQDYLQPMLQSLALGLPIFLYLDSARRTALLVGIIYFVIYSGSSLASRKSGAFSKLFSRPATALNWTLSLGFAGGILAGLFYQSPWPMVSVVLFIVIFLLENLRKPTGISVISDHTNTTVLASVLSIESQIKSLITGVVALILGFLADQYGVSTALLSLSGTLFCLSFLLWLSRD